MPSILKEDSSDIDALFKELEGLKEKFSKNSTKKELNTFRSMLYEIKEEIKHMVDGVNIESREQAKQHLKNSREVLHTINNQIWLEKKGFYNDVQKTGSIFSKRVDTILYLIFDMDSEEQKELEEKAKIIEPRLKEIERLEAEGRKKDAEILKTLMTQEEIQQEKILQDRYTSLQSDLPSEEAKEASKKLENLIEATNKLYRQRPTISYGFTTFSNTKEKKKGFGWFKKNKILA